MNNIEILFFDLIHVSIGTAVCLSRTPSAAEWQTLYEMALKQSLVGVSFAGVQKLQAQQQTPPEVLYLQWMGIAAKIQQRNEVVNRQCVEVQKKMEADGFRTFIMKGQGNSALYRTSYDNENLQTLRQSGDIDIYLEGGFKKVYDYVQRTCPTKEVNELEIHYHILPDTEVEIHYKPFIMRNPFKNRKLQRIFKELMDKEFSSSLALDGENKLAINVPSIEFNLVHQLVHIYHHLFTTGIGLRQLMDYYFLLRSVKNVENVKESKECIHSLGLDRFASVLMWVICHVFDPQMLETWNLKPETALWKSKEKDGRFLLNEIMMAGNFGHHDDRIPQRMSAWKSFWYLNWHNMRLLRFDPWFWFWTPLWRIYHFAWRKMKGFY